MIDQNHATFYISFALLSTALIVLYIKIKSTEAVIINRPEFRIFQNSFLTGYSSMILCELLAQASFYSTLYSFSFSIEKITKLYIVTIVSTTIFGLLAEIIDIGSRKDKCVCSALLYSISMLSLFFGGHYEMLLMGRVTYGAAAAFHHSSFEAYIIHEHTNRGWPDDWLTETFGLLTHSMTLVAGLSGVIGQTAATSGTMGPPGLSCVLFLITGIYILVGWNKDSSGPRFMLSNFLFNVNQTLNAAKSNKQMLYLLIISALCETSITLFTFYWAPWISSMIIEEDQTVPFEIVFSTYILASMLGNYLHQMYAATIGADFAFQSILFASSFAFLFGAMLQTPVMAFGASIVIYICIGGYWPSVGNLRGKFVQPEMRSTSLTLTRVVTLIISITILHSIHHSPMLILITCATLNGAAAYFQMMVSQDGASVDVEIGKGSRE